MDFKAGRLVAGFMAVAMVQGCAHRISPEISRCESLETLKLENAEVAAAEAVAAGRHFSAVSLLMAHEPFMTLPAHCRVQLRLHPSADSDILAEVWLPQDTWNGRFQGIGSGGLAGHVDPFMLSLAVRAGFAASHTDTGHVSTDKQGAWALNHPEKIRDFGWRANHEVTLKAKQLIKAYYGRAQDYSYFTGGSYGGRTALKIAQKFPNDYDGIIAGCPAYDGSNTVPTIAWEQKRMAEVPGAYLPAAKLQAITDNAVKACDALDGVADGVIDDPRRCPFKPSSMLCKGKETDECLTPEQAETVRRMYAGPGGGIGDSRNRGYEPGSEAGAGAWKDWHTGTKPGNSAGFLYSLEFFRYFVFNDPNWDLGKFDFKRDGKIMREVMGPDYDARDPDLSRFKAHGGKLIMYHGWADSALQPRLAVDYYENVRKTMGAEQQDAFMRFYMVPGMKHCFAGPGPNFIGQVPGGTGDPAHSISASMLQWVEQGKAPESIIAAKYENDFAPFIDSASLKPLRTRPICRYPKVARYSGSGSTDEAQNFRCVAPPP